MADLRSIHEFTTGEVEATTLLLGDFLDMDAQSGYTTYKMSVSDLGEVILEDIEYTQDLQTTDKTIVGAINENKSVIGYSYDEYDATTAYSTGDLCIYNNTLYKALQATTGNLPTNTTYWEPTSIADEISELNTGKQDTITNSTTTLTPASGVSLSAVNCARYGKVVNLICGVNVTTPSSWQVLTTLPTGYRPPQQTYGVMCKSSSASGKLTAHINVEPNGNVRLANDLPDAGGTYNFCLSWIIG